MFSGQERELCKEALDYFGEDAQILKTVEELNELSVALMHYRDKKATKLHVKGELADVLIMCEQMCIKFGFDLNLSIVMKLRNLHDRIEREKKLEGDT